MRVYLEIKTLQNPVCFASRVAEPNIVKFDVALKLFNINIDLLFLSVSMNSSDFSRMFNYRKYSTSSGLGLSHIRAELVRLSTR